MGGACQPLRRSIHALASNPSAARMRGRVAPISRRDRPANRSKLDDRTLPTHPPAAPRSPEASESHRPMRTPGLSGFLESPRRRECRRHTGRQLLERYLTVLLAIGTPRAGPNRLAVSGGKRARLDGRLNCEADHVSAIPVPESRKTAALVRAPSVLHRMARQRCIRNVPECDARGSTRLAGSRGTPPSSRHAATGAWR